ncbi:ABC transporter ATP-binding protein [Microlunatus sp. GCM10028923]|uniref:ABC transporter ATP-binding protein n=1 Tax=Microlunatus sp. GCM10028923 TaxID=3273400 RepID=UPI00361DA53D
MTAETTGQPVLRVEDLTTEFDTAGGTVRAVNGVGFAVAAGETLGVVGESGSGKSITLLSLLGLLPANGRVVSGSVRFGDLELIKASERRLQQVRGGGIGMIFQDPMTALNPVMTIAQQIDESLRRHSRGLGRRGRRARVVELLDQVGIPRAARRADQFPHEFSGGMRQRAMIAMAMANRPAVLLADEPTTALDVTVQAQILDLLQELQRETGTALVLITHDLGVIAEVADRAVVMYAGRVVEEGTVTQLFHDPRHPYSRGLLRSRPTLAAVAGAELPAIPGQPPNPARLPEGCAFRPRCDRSAGRDACLSRPELIMIDGGHAAACHFEAETEPAELGRSA